MAKANETQAESANNEADVTIIKKYANRRLYNTATSSYVTLDYLSEMVKRNEEFVVKDAKSGEDITRTVLTQIIFEEESKGQNLLPVNFLRKLIKYYGDNLQSFVPSYLEMSMETFQKNQETMRQTLSESFAEAPGFKIFEDVARQNMSVFEQSMKMFGLPGTANPWAAGQQSASSESKDAEIASLRQEIEALKAQLATKK